MNCPNCGHPDHQVLRTKALPAGIERTRECLKCAKRFKTVEAPAEVIQRAEEIAESFRALARVVGGEE